ncbi:hypothetical protein PCC7418_2902 [Halothece sp. PCC 7418]|uniref:hypothetical protein n=1 Tax=Halothece sp. (strain PCC 7418) TaxID=65093 RepID=UPI0002A07EF4|nr:hypothetical protein [Halothece sp. PCC 7418]AFZ45032.1 hypothetical protein PCC7418_2902 [Halothece sp. PCC 7418]
MTKFPLILSVAALTSLPIFMSVNKNLYAQEPTEPPEEELMEAPELPEAPENCTYLQEVSTREIEIRKVVRTGNQNTDFVVPSGSNFTSYIPQLLAENNAEYRIRVFFKFSDGSSASVFQNTLAMERFERVADEFQSPSERQPFQINFNVNSARNNAYRVSVLGCE